MTGLLVSAFPAVNYLHLYHRSVELNGEHYLWTQILIRLSFWALKLNQTCTGLLTIFLSLMGAFSGEHPIDICIECDASLPGWGASCSGKFANGQWPILEAHNHIIIWSCLLPCNFMLCNNLGQYKMEQLSPIPPKQWWRCEWAKNVPFWYHWNGGRGGPDVPFILSKIEAFVPY